MGPEPVNKLAPLERDQPARPSKPNLKPLTGLRFFAALAVVIYHFASPASGSWPSPFRQLAGSGYAAVSFFFLLSGFILSYSYLGRSGELRGTLRSFFIARIARIYPAYLLAFVMMAPHNIFASLQANAFPVAQFKLLVSGLALLSLQQAWTPWTAWCWNYPAWSVSVEAFFYLTFPWIAPRFARFNLPACLKLCAGLWVTSLLAPSLLVLMTGITTAPNLDDNLQKAVEFSPLLRWPEFLIGVLLGRAFTLGMGDWLPNRGLSSLALVTILGILSFLPGIPHPLLANGLLVPLFACLILSLTKDHGVLSRFLSMPPIVMLGEASYGIYILQIPVSYLLRTPPPHHSLSVFALYLAVLVLAALVSWKFVELPLRKYVRDRFTGTHLAETKDAKPGPDRHSQPAVQSDSLNPIANRRIWRAYRKRFVAAAAIDEGVAVDTK